MAGCTTDGWCVMCTCSILPHASCDPPFRALTYLCLSSPTTVSLTSHNTTSTSYTKSMELAARRSRSRSGSSSDTSSLSDEEEIDQSQSSEHSSSPSASEDHSDNPESRSHSPIEAASTSTSSDSDEGEASDMKATSQAPAHTQPAKMDGTMSQRKDSTQGLPGDDLHVSKKAVAAIRKEVQPKDSASTSPPMFVRDRIESDRKDEFERTSSLGRAAARQKIEHTPIDQAQSRVTREEKTGESSKQPPKMAAHESHTLGNGGEQTAVEQRYVCLRPSVQAYSACKADKKASELPHPPTKERTDCLAQNPLKDGDLLISLGTDDYTKSFLIDSRDFCKASESLARLYSSSVAASEGCAIEQELKGFLIFHVAGSTPEILPVPLHCALSHVTPTLKAAQKSDEVKIKVESDPKTTDNSIATDWSKACDSLLRSVFARQRAHGVSRKNLAAALPQIEGIVSIAQQYGLAHEIQSDFDSLFLEYIGNGRFWELIAQQPVRCLKIGIALKKLPVYEEAFKHLVGISANSKAGTHFDGLPDDIQAIIQRRSRELYNLRRDINEDLLLISISTQNNSKTPQKYLSSTVSQHNRPDDYSTVNVFRDWMAEHIGYLRGNTSGPAPGYYLCDHKRGCNTVAGFYRVIDAGREAYLPGDMVWDTFKDSFLHDPEEGEFGSEVVKIPLTTLKDKASKYVSGLVKSTLHLPSKHELDYLTCVTVGSEDVQWDVSGKDGESEDEDGN